jgi:RNA 3'-terminal phosphate cyclase (ATP)
VASSLEPIRIDGAQGEGGGQILRTAICLSAISEKPIEVVNIRAKRSNPGLRPQHVTAIKILEKLFRATVENLQVGADWIRFRTSGYFEGGSIKFDVGTAGSVPMILAAVVPAVSLTNNDLEIELSGGTDVRASPTVDYVRYVLAEAYRSIGLRFSLDVIKRGYYPKGGGRVRVDIDACRSPGTVELFDLRVAETRIASVCCQLPKHVAERQISSALIALEKKGISCNNYSASLETSISPGSSVIVYSASDFGPFIGGDSIGELGKRAEAVGAEAADKFLESALGHFPVDTFLSDMLVVPLALARGKSSYRVARVTSHLETNLRVASQIVGCKYQISKKENGYIVQIEG